jgi:3-oxoadipate enol-lactonase
MPEIKVNNLVHYYELAGEGNPLVFIHGAFADAKMWDPQWQSFSRQYRVLRYDLRGHGRTGTSTLERYSMATYANDLASLLEALDIQTPVLCGQSWGGSIAQVYAARQSRQPRALIMAGSMVAIDLTFKDKVLCNVLFPWWVMSAVIILLGVKNFTRFSMQLARLTMGKHWLSRDPAVRVYLEQCMYRMDSQEYQKIWQAIYGFHLSPLERITCPTLVLNGELEPKNTYQHTQAILQRVGRAETRIIPGAQHAMNLEEPGLFNEYVEEFLHRAV